MTFEIISRSNSKIWNLAKIELAAPGSTIGLATDYTMGPVQTVVSLFYSLVK